MFTGINRKIVVQLTIAHASRLCHRARTSEDHARTSGDRGQVRPCLQECLRTVPLAAASRSRVEHTTTLDFEFPSAGHRGVSSLLFESYGLTRRWLDPNSVSQLLGLLRKIAHRGPCCPAGVWGFAPT
eukprot:1180159-Prorocentrum_minimum.AAC.4